MYTNVIHQACIARHTAILIYMYMYVIHLSD